MFPGFRQMKNRLFQRTSFFAILLAALSVAVLAQQQQALQISPSVDRLRQHVSYLASDALEGRRTGSPGANDAAHYIAGEFSRLGLRPATQTARAPKTRGEALSRFLQRFPYVAGVQLGKGNEMALSTDGAATSNNLRVGEDWMPLGLSSNARIENTPATFVGYGLTVSGLKYDDYATAHAAGSIAIALSGTPDGDNPHGPFARYEDVRWKAIAARNAGAKALIVLAREENFKDDRLSLLHYDNSGGDVGLAVVGISRQALQRVLELPASSLSDIEGALRHQMLTSVGLHNVSVAMAIDLVRQEVAASNVIGILEGSDANVKSEALVIGAHYDHLGRGGEGSLAPREGDIHHGADDNASGVAGVLELARIFTAQPKPRRTIMFIAFSGEEEGLLGSNYYVNHPLVPLTNTVAMINMDMIGRMKNKNLIIGGIGTAEEWRSMMDGANIMQAVTVIANGGSAQATSGLPNTLPQVVASNGRTVVSSDPAKQFQLTLNDDGYGPSDHSSFYARQIPVLFFWTGTHDDYHKPSDTADKINYEDEARVLTFVARIVRNIDAAAKRLTYTVAKSESTGRATGFRVYLGTIPNYAESNNGLLLDGVRDDSPAAKAGLKAGDRVVKMAGHEVRNVYDYTYALGEMKAGQEYELEVVRGNERLKLKITPSPRK
jgi:aminopeptidase YwaD